MEEVTSNLVVDEFVALSMLHLCTNTFSQSALFQFAVLRLTSDICSRLHLNIATMKQILHSRNLRNWQVSERLVKEGHENRSGISIWHTF